MPWKPLLLLLLRLVMRVLRQLRQWAAAVNVNMRVQVTRLGRSRWQAWEGRRGGGREAGHRMAQRKIVLGSNGRGVGHLVWGVA